MAAPFPPGTVAGMARALQWDTAVIYSDLIIRLPPPPLLQVERSSVLRPDPPGLPGGPGERGGRGAGRGRAGRAG